MQTGCCLHTPDWKAKMYRRTDMVVFMSDAIYVLELKINDTAKNALNQILERGYARQYMTDGRRVVMVGIRMNLDTRTIDDWVVCG